MVHLFTGLDNASQRQRQADRLASLNLGRIRVSYLPKSLKQAPPARFGPGDIVLIDISYAGHNVVSQIAKAANAGGARVIRGRLSLGRIVEEVRERLAVA